MRRFSQFLFSGLLLLAPLAIRAQTADFPSDQLKAINQKWPDAKTTKSGLRYLVQEEGTGDNIQKGDLAEVLYVGTLLTGDVFDKVEDPAKPMKFKVGTDNVIPGFEQGIQLMKKGGKMTVIIPPALAYGVRGVPEHGIYRNATLIFELTVLNVTHPAPPAAKKK